MNAFIAAAATFFVLAALTFFWIPGIAIIFAITGAVVAVAGAFAGRVRAPRRHIVWFGVGIALVGMVCVPTIDPIAGLLILMGGAAIAAAAPLIAAASS